MNMSIDFVETDSALFALYLFIVPMYYDNNGNDRLFHFPSEVFSTISASILIKDLLVEHIT